MEEETFSCNECEAEFTIIYEAAQGYPTMCPFCGSDFPDEDEEDWDNPNPYGDADD